MSNLISAMLVRGSELSAAEQALREASRKWDEQSQVQTELQQAEMQQARLQEEVSRLSQALSENDSHKQRQFGIATGAAVRSSVIGQVLLRDELNEAAKSVKLANEATAETRAAVLAEAALQSRFQEMQESYEAALSRETEKVAKVKELTSKVQTAEDQQKALELRLAQANAQASVGDLRDAMHSSTQTDMPVSVSQQAMEKLALDLRQAEMRQYSLEAELSAAWADMTEMTVYPAAMSFQSDNPSLIQQASANFLWHPKLY